MGADQTGFCGCMRYLRSAVLRSKPLDRDGMMETPLNRNLSQIHILMYGIGSMIGNAIYGVIAVVARSYSGPSTFLCFLLAGVVGLLNGMSYSELSAQIPKAGSSFVYTYIIAGEFMAFMCGWLALLEYIVTASSSAVLASNTVDILSNGTLFELVHEYIGTLSTSNDGVLSHYPNIMAFVICLFAMAVLTCGNDASFLINIVLSAVTVGIIIIASIFMFTKFDADYMISKTHGSFFPNGVGGLLSGAGIAFGTFIGFEAMTVAGEEVKDPQRTIPKAIFKAIGIVVIMCLFYALSFTGYTPWWDVNPDMGLAAVFFHPPVMWLRILVCIGTIAAAFCNILCALYAITRITYAMANDGLLFKWLGWVHPTLKVPLFSLYAFGLLLGTLAIFFTYASLTSFLSITAVLAYIIVSCDLLILRFMKPELYPEKPGKEIGYLYSRFSNLKFIEHRSRGFAPCLAVACFIVSSAALLFFCLDVSEPIIKGYAWAAFVLVLLLLAVGSSLLIIALHRPYSGPKGNSDFYKVPCVPYVPLLCIFLNIAVIIKLSFDSWVRVGLWVIFGLVVYFGYGVWRSELKDYKPTKEERYNVIPGANSSLVELGSENIIDSDDESDTVMNTDHLIVTDEKTPIIR